MHLAASSAYHSCPDDDDDDGDIDNDYDVDDVMMKAITMMEMVTVMMTKGN